MIQPWEITSEKRTARRLEHYTPIFENLSKVRDRRRLISIINPVLWVRDIVYAWRVLPLAQYGVYVHLRQSVKSAWAMRFSDLKKFYSSKLFS